MAGLARGAFPVPLPALGRTEFRGLRQFRVYPCVRRQPRHQGPRRGIELTGHVQFPNIGHLPYLLTLPGHGFYWFQLCGPAEQS